MEQVLEKTNVASLERSITNLINGYHHSEELLQSQIQAVIDGNFDKLNELIPKQISYYKFLADLESDFRRHLQSAAKSLQVDKKLELKLSVLLRYLPNDDGQLTMKRDELKRVVNRSRTLSLQLIDLIRFAQSFNVNTLQTIAATFEKQTEHYDGKGQKNRSHLATFSIDEKG